MNRIKLRIAAIALLMLLAVAPALTAQSRKGRVYGVAFYNLENLFDTINNNGKYDLEFSPQGKYQWDSQKYWKKIHNIAQVIASMKTRTTPEGPAVIALSEIENITVLKDLVKDPQIASKSYQIVHHDSPDLRGVDVGLIYNPRMFKLERVTNHRLKIESMPNFRTRDQMCVVGTLNGDRIAFIVNHWPSRRGGTEQSSHLREAAAALSKQIADSLLTIDPKMGVIVMGDLNDYPNNRSVTDVLLARKKQDKTAPGEFFNPFWKLFDDGIGSYIYRGSWGLFDQIILSYNLTEQGASPLKYLNAIVRNDEFLRQQEGRYKGYPLRTFSEGRFTGGYSDHFPTEVFLFQPVK
ncbi:MAG: endonuclease/exonuclease/phosphatase family protein [Muribaculaceae bacterium]|nr:endonuclease/exonuclease/phosphatase family protein [Muribaculaceae bacterium]